MEQWWEDPSLAEYLKEEAEQGNAQAQCELGRQCLRAGQKDDAYAWFEKSAMNGDKDAMYNLACLYEGDTDNPDAKKKAMYWYAQGAANGDPEAMYHNARMLLEDEASREDGAAAVLLRKALSLGYGPAQALLYQIPGEQALREQQLADILEREQEAISLIEADNLNDALTILEDVLKDSTDRLGDMDATTISLMALVAEVLSRTKAYERSIPMKEHVLERRGKSLSLSDLDYIQSQLTLASDYASVRRFQSSLRFSSLAYTAAKESRGELHPMTLHALSQYARDLMHVCKHDQATKLLEYYIQSADKAEDKETYCDYLEDLEKLLSHSRAITEENAVFFGLEESRRSYAYICAEVVEMLSVLPESYTKRIHEKEWMHLKEQADLVGCYIPHMNQGKGVEPDPYTNALQTLISYKYLMPNLAECVEEEDGLQCRCIITWIQNELYMILTLYPNHVKLPHMAYPQPLDFVKPLNTFAQNHAKICAIDALDLKLTQDAQGGADIIFAYGNQGEIFTIHLTYDALCNTLTGEEHFGINPCI